MEVNLNQNEEYKETELGLLPRDWEVVRIGDVFEIKQGKQLSSKESVENKIKKPFLRTSNITWGKIDISNIDFMYFTNEEFEKLKLKIGDILVCEGGDIGRTALYRGELKEAAYQNHLHRLRPREEGVSEEFFVFWMNHAINQRQMYLYTANRTTIPNLSSSRLKNFKIPLPPLFEQQKIAFVLSTVQEAKEKTEDVIKALKELKKSMMKHLFTYGPVPVEEAEHVPLKETEIGLVPEEWEVVRLGDVVEIHDKERVPLNSAERSKMIGLYPYCGANGIIDYVNNYIFDGEFVLLAEDGGFWRKFENTAYLMEGKFWVNNHAHIIRAIENRSINRFLLYWFIFDNIEKYTSGTTRKKLNQNVMKKILIPLPPLSVQQKITSILSAIDQKIEAEENKKKALEDLFQSMLHHLMTAKVRVNHLEVEA